MCISTDLEIGERSGNLCFPSRHLDLLLEPGDRNLNFALPESKLCECRHSRLLGRAQNQGFAAKCFCGRKALTPLEDCERLVNEGQGIE